MPTEKKPPVLTLRMLPFGMFLAGSLCAGAALAAADGRTTAEPAESTTPAKVSRDGWPLPADAEPGIREAIAALNADSRFLSHASSVLIARCMDEQGFTYPVESLDAPVYPRDASFGLTVEEARRSGYVTQSNILAIPEEDKSYLPTGAGEAKAWGQALFGPDDAPVVSIDIPLVRGEVGSSSVGCLADAQRRLFGSVEAAIRRNMVAGNTFNMAERQAGVDPQKAALDGRWAACMAGAGRPALTEPGRAVAKARVLAGGKLSGLSSGEPLAIAVDDALCQEEVNYAPLRRAIEDRYLSAVLDTFPADIAAARASTAAALERARELDLR